MAAEDTGALQGAPKSSIKVAFISDFCLQNRALGSMIQCSKAPTAQRSHTVKDQLKLVIIKKRMGKIPLFWLSKIPVTGNF